MRVPFIARWPAVISPGGRCDQPAAHVDVYPTLLELAGASNSPDHVLDGVSLAPLFRAPSAGLEREAIYWHFPGYLESYIPEAVWRTTPVSTIRMGDYKLLEFFEDNRVELYNLASDLGERHNLASELPDRAHRLRAKLRTWREEIGALMPREKTAAELASPRDVPKAKR